MPKNKKDPNKPKGVKTAYIFFTEHRREEMIRSGQRVQEFGPFSRECSEHWKCLGEDEKMPFVLLSNKDRARHQREMENYSAPESDSDDEGPRRKKKKKKMKDPNAPKRNISAYFFFAAKNRPSVKEELVTANEGENPRCTQVMKVIAERWSMVHDHDKKEFEDQAENDRSRYQRQLQQYNNTGHFEPEAR